MRAARPGAGRRAVLLAVALGACGPYTDLAQKLDVTARIAGDTWIAAGPDRQEVRMILVGKPDANGVAPFAFTSIAAACFTLQGSWTEFGSAGETKLAVAHTYTMPVSTGTGGKGNQRDDTPYGLTITVARSAGQLVVTGDARLAGTYVGLSDALGRLGSSTPRDAACAYQVASLAVQSSEIRIIGFGSNQMLQYRKPASYVGTVSGSLKVTVSIDVTGTSAATRIEYFGFADQGGVVLDGEQVTNTNFGGDGRMSGTLGFSLQPLSLDPAAVTTPIAGGIDYQLVTLGNGSTSGGAYIITLDPGGAVSTLVDAVAPPNPSPVECLSLP